MAARIKIPAAWRKLTDGKSEVELTGQSVGAMVKALESEYPGFVDRLLDEKGSLRRFVNIYVNGEDVKFLSGLDTPVGDKDIISIIPAVGGGQ
jgi:sulfur-carrier protein